MIDCNNSYNRKMKIFKIIVGSFILFLTLVFTLGFFNRIVYAQQCSDTDYDCQIENIQKEIDSLTPAHEKNKGELSDLKDQLKSLDQRIKALGVQLNAVALEIRGREEDLAYAQEIFEEKANHHYRFIRLYDPITPFLASSDATEAFREINFRQKAIDDDRKTMEGYAADLFQLKTDKDALEAGRASLASLQSQVDERASFLEGEVEKVETYLASLSAKQQQFITLKLGSLNLPTSLGAGPLYCTDDRNLDPGFRPAFAFYTFGIPHRVGMNQYGAYGRAKAGQSHEDILRAYFDNFNFETRGNINIDVVGHGVMSLETYLLGIYEMPESWPLEALKAQAIAARSYALAYTGNGTSSICTSQKCQVYKGGNKGGNWEVAVNQTQGKIMVSGGQPIKAWYASTAGGYTFNSGDVWGTTTSYTKRMRDTTSGVAGFSDLAGSSYDKESPCFYSAQGWRSEYAKSAWLKSEEVADIANVLKVAQAGAPSKHLYQTDKPNPEGSETWSSEKVKDELRARGKSPFNSVSNVSVSGVDWGLGRATSITVSGDKGSETFGASEFKNYFNLRAPANIQIVGPLFNVEKL